MIEQQWLTSTSPTEMWEYCRDRVTESQARSICEAYWGLDEVPDPTGIVWTVEVAQMMCMSHVEARRMTQLCDILRDIVNPFPTVRKDAGWLWAATKRGSIIEWNTVDWLTWRDGTIPAMVDDILMEPCDKEICCCGSELDGSHDHYTCGPPIPVTSIPRAEPQWELLPVLADALEDAGCSDAAILEHLRSERDGARCAWCSGCGGCSDCNPESETCDHCNGTGRRKVRHWRGCWVLTLLGAKYGA